MEDFSWLSIGKIIWNKLFVKKPSVIKNSNNKNSLKDNGIIVGDIAGNLQQQNDNSKKWDLAIYKKNITQNITYIIQKEMGISVQIDDENRERLYEITAKYIKSQKEMQKFLKKVVQYCEEYGYKSIPLKTIKILQEMDDDSLDAMRKFNNHKLLASLSLATPFYSTHTEENYDHKSSNRFTTDTEVFYEQSLHCEKLIEIDRKYQD